MRFIEKIEISKFRSIGENEQIESLDYNVFSGSNDSGKSNVLKALNLFFNNQTEINTPFNPDADFNKWFRDNNERGQRNIRIKLTFKSDSYQDPGGINDGFIAEKEYSDDGGIYVKYYFKNLTRIEQGSRSYKKANSVISDKIKYVYIPTIRDSVFRGNVQKQIDNIVQSSDRRFKTQNQKLKASFGELENAMNVQLGELKKRVEEVMGMNIGTIVNFSTLLESMSFDTSDKIIINKRSKEKLEAQKVSLQCRGEGVQMQFFSFLLWFISKNDTKHKYIWGFEEPEIAFEFKRQFEVSKLFQKEFIKIVQIFLTTHSPAFAFADEDEHTKIYRVSYVKDNRTKTKQRLISKIKPLTEYYNNLFSEYEKGSNNEQKALERNIWGINIQKLSHMLGSSLEPIIGYRHIDNEELKRLQEVIKELSNEKEYLRNEVQKMQRHIDLTSPTKVFICEDESLVKFWETLFANNNILGIIVYSSGGCANNHIEEAMTHLIRLKHNYHPRIFRQIDRDGLINKQILLIQDFRTKKYIKIKHYMVCYLPVNEVENFGVLMRSDINNDTIRANAAVYDSAMDAFNNTVKNNCLAYLKFLDRPEDKNKFNGVEDELRAEARKDMVRFLPGKEIAKIHPKYNPITAISGAIYDAYPQELKDYLDKIRAFFA